MVCKRMKMNYHKRYCVQTLEVTEDVVDRNQEGLMGVEEDTRKLGCRNWREDAQERGRWRHFLEEAKAHPGLYS